MRRIILFLLLAGLLAAQNPNTSGYPGAVVTDERLGVAKDRSESELTAGIDAVTLSVPVKDGSQFLGYQIVTVDNERMQICSVAGNTLTICTGGRGFSGSTAASHATGARVRAQITAWMDNQAAAEIKAIQAALGANLGNVAAASHQHAASAITSGTFDTARIPSLDASKITSGTLGADRIPTLDASKIGSGILAAARGGSGADLSAAAGVLKIASGVTSTVAGSATDCVRVDGTSGACGSGSGLPSQTGNANKYLATNGTDAAWRAIAAGPTGALQVTHSASEATLDIVTAVLPQKAAVNTFTGLNTFDLGIIQTPRTAPSSPTNGQSWYDSSLGKFRCQEGGATKDCIAAGGGLGDPGANGVVVRTALNTTTARTITGTANRITVVNGDGVGGPPTLDAGTNIVDKTAANTYSAGAKQTPTPSATTSGLNVGSLAGDPSSGANGDIHYNSSANKFRCYQNGAYVDCIPPGSGFDPFDRTTIAMYDEFLPTGTVTDGNIGQWGWDLSGTGCTASVASTDVAAEANHPGLVAVKAGATANNNCAINMLGGSSNVQGITYAPNSTAGWEWRFQFKTGTPVTNVTYLIGALAAYGSADVPVQGAQLYASSATGISCNAGSTSPTTGNWLFVSRDTTANKWCYDTGVALVANTWIKFRVRSTSAGTHLYSFATGTDDFGGEQSNTSYLPSDAIGPLLSIRTLTTTGQTMLVDRVSALMTGLTR